MPKVNSKQATKSKFTLTQLSRGSRDEAPITKSILDAVIYLQQRHQNNREEGAGEKKARSAIKIERMKKLKANTWVQSTNHKYQVLHLLGSGGFGDVYKVRQEASGEVWPEFGAATQIQEYAMKTEPNGLENTGMMRLVMELQILVDCNNVKDPKRKEHFIPLIDKGKVKTFKYIVMGLVSLSLEDIRKKVVKMNFSASTAMQCTMQTLQAIWDLHDVGYIHRDIKPGNFAVGLGPKETMIFILDFGIGRRYRDSKGVAIKKDRTYCKFMGTVRYASRNCHNNMEQSRKDDLEVWLYMAMELFDENAVPWRHYCFDRQKVKELKQQFFENKCPPRVFSLFPAEFVRITKYVDKLKYAEDPDYKYLMTELTDISKERQIDLEKPLDWAGLITADVLDNKKKPEVKPQSEMQPVKDENGEVDCPDEDEEEKKEAEDPYAKGRNMRIKKGKQQTSKDEDEQKDTTKPA